MPASLSKKAPVRSRNSWFFLLTYLDNIFEFSLGYKYSDQTVTFFSAAKRNSVVKPPWDPPVQCQFRITSDKQVQTEWFRFENKHGSNQHLNVSLLNNLFPGESDFGRTCTSMVVNKKQELLALYMTLLPHSKGFSHHREDLHHASGIRVDGQGVGEQCLEKLDGSLKKFLEFKTSAEKSAFVVSQSKLEAISKIVEGKGYKKRKSQSEAAVGEGPKISKDEAKIKAQEEEIGNKEGIEQAFVDSFVGQANVKIEKLSISPKICPTVNPFRVNSIAYQMKWRFDPSKIRMIVAPADPSKFDQDNLPGNEYIVVSGSHSLAALQKLDKAGEMRKLVSLSQGSIPCYIVNTENPSVLCYGRIRSDDLDSKFVRKPQIQDLLFVFNTLKGLLKDGREAVEVVTQYATLLVFSADDITALKKFCSWQAEPFACLLSVLQKFELYETTDSKYEGTQSRLMRGESLPVPKVLFKKLAKVDQSYFEVNVPKVLDRELSLKELVLNFEEVQEYEKTQLALIELSQNQTLQELQQKYPGKFEKEVLDKFKGAVVERSKQNMNGQLLKKYYEAVVADPSSHHSSLVSFHLLDTLETFIDQRINEYDLTVLNIKTNNVDVLMKALNQTLYCSDLVKTVLILFSSEHDQSSTLSYIRSQSIPSDFLLTQLIFDNDNVKKGKEIIENLKFGILAGKTKIFAPPLDMYNQSLGNLEDVVSKICQPKASVAYVSEGDSPLISIHGHKHISRSTTYFASEKLIKLFENKVRKEKLLDEGLEPDVNETCAISSIENTGDSTDLAVSRAKEDISSTEQMDEFIALAGSRAKEVATDDDDCEHVGPAIEESDGEEKFYNDEYEFSEDEAYCSILESSKDILNSVVIKRRIEDYQADLDMELVEASLDQVEHRRMCKSSSTSRVSYNKP